MGTCRLSSADMKKFAILICFLVFEAQGKPSKRAAEEEKAGECCGEKRVGNVLYQLFSEGDVKQLARYNCLSGCIYKDEEDPQGPSFCFARGDLPVECMDDFHWCYEGDCGPEFWETRFEDCAGESQSPIDVEWPENSLENAQPGELNFEGYDRLRTLRMSNEDDEQDGVMTGPVLGEGQSYQMLQLHFHWGADDSRGYEHTINGEEFPMEMHIVHKKVGLTVEEALSTSDGLAVVGQMFQITDEDNEVLNPLIESLANIENFNDKFDMIDSPLKVEDLLPAAGGEYANYNGSLTTPTCNEAVRWILFKQPILISARQMEAFRALKDNADKPMVDNYRPPQPLNGREVNFFTA